MRYILVLAVLLSAGCMTNKALDHKPIPTKLSGYWSASATGKAIHWFIRPDG